MDPEDWSPMVCEALETSLRSVRAFAAWGAKSGVNVDTAQAYLLEVVANLEAVKAIVSSDGEKTNIDAEAVENGRVEGVTGQTTFVLSTEKETIEKSTLGMKSAVIQAREKIELEERVRAAKRAERQAQRERKLQKEQEDAEEKASAPTSWFCPGCTFENRLSARKCEVCSTYRPADAAPLSAPLNAKETKASTPRRAAKKSRRKPVEDEERKWIEGEAHEGAEDEGKDEGGIEAEIDEDEVDEPHAKKSKAGDAGDAGAPVGRKRRIFPTDKRLKINRGGDSGPASAASTSGKRTPKSATSAGSKVGRKRGFSAVANDGSTPQSAFGSSPREGRDRSDSLGSEMSSGSAFDVGRGGGGDRSGRGSLWLRASGGRGDEDFVSNEEDQGVLVWVCAVCTLENEMRARTCAACGESRAHTIRGVPSLLLSEDSARIKRVKVSDNPRKDPLVGETHQIDPASLPAVISHAKYVEQLSLQGGAPNSDSALWEVVWVAVDEDDPRTQQPDGSGLFADYPGMEEPMKEGPAERSPGFMNGSSTPLRYKPETNLTTPGGASSSSSGRGSSSSGSSDAQPHGNGEALTPRTGYKIVNGQRYPDIPIPEQPQPRSHFETYIAEQPDKIPLSLLELFKAGYQVDAARCSRDSAISRQTDVSAKGNRVEVNEPGTILTSWSEEPLVARPLLYRYRHFAQHGYDYSPTIETFAGSLVEDFEAAISENGEHWNNVRRAMRDEFTTRELQDFFYSVWSTSAFKEQRRRAERKFDSICRAKETAEAKEKARKAAEKKKEEKERRREEKERAKLEQSDTRGLQSIAEEAHCEIESKTHANGNGEDCPTSHANGTGDAVHSGWVGPPSFVTTPAPTLGPASEETDYSSGFVQKTEF